MSFLESWRLLGALLGGLGGSLGSFLVSWTFLGTLFLILEALLKTFWHHMDPRTDFLDLGRHLGSILEDFWEFGWVWGVTWEAFGWPLGCFRQRVF